MEHRPDRKPTLLYVSPVIPGHAGKGMGVRSAAQILALSELFELSLAIVLFGADTARVRTDLPPEIKEACAEIHLVSIDPLLNRMMSRLKIAQLRVFLEALWPLPFGFAGMGEGLDRVADAIAAAHQGHRFDVLHCFRLTTAPILPRLRRRGVTWSRAVLDMDDYESFSKFRYARDLRAEIGLQYTLLKRLEAIKLAALEARRVPRFDDGYVCSLEDQARLRRRFPRVRWLVVPNVVPTPPPVPRNPQGHFTFLFVGTLNNAPNSDAVLFFCQRVIPKLRAEGGPAFGLIVAGHRPGPAITALAAIDGVEIVADPPELGPCYARADAAIVPIRSGAGTRIKILEALSYGVPVVSTTLGAEGMDLTPEVDLLIADDADRFAAQCRRLMTDAALRDRLAANGHTAFQTRYSMAQLGRTLRQAHAPNG